MDEERPDRLGAGTDETGTGKGRAKDPSGKGKSKATDEQR